MVTVQRHYQVVKR